MSSTTDHEEHHDAGSVVAPADFELAQLPFLRRPLHKLLGTRAAAPLAKMGLETAEDLLRHYPRRYAEPGTMTDMAALALGEHVTVVAKIRSATVRTMRSRAGAMLHVKVSDGVSELNLTFFAKRAGVLRMHEDKLRPGRTGLFTGTVSDYRGERQLTHPDYLIIGVDTDDTDQAIAAASRPIPVRGICENSPASQRARLAAGAPQVPV